ncbi:MAG TPA: PAS domain-containing sensor histidine kinase [Salinivirga sp.]|uniref:PAS domain-containing sensor histidine kinase n=1 Tax=Salinivirga sp. TaxID=1970192 RepID=UPI002B49DF43|nr:PAS domain-containing sensor histidine kinase [Salinivirga sp.]HKK58700.1 PAS domain-containing sensor histidine kinase [Salinivirga sp.]
MSKTKFDIEHVLKLEAVFNNPIAGLNILNKNGDIESINQAMADELGESQNSLEGTSIKKFLNKKSKELLSEYMQHSAEKPEDEKQETIELQINRPEKSDRHIELALSDTYIRKELFFIGVVKDITPEKALQKKLEEQKAEKEKIKANLEKEQAISELKNRFVSMASHEFRAPLAGLLSSVNLIDRYITNSKNHWEKFPYHTHIEKHLKILKKALHNLQSILNEFLSIGKLEAGKLESQTQIFHLGDFFHTHKEQVNEIITPPQQLNYNCNRCNIKVEMDKTFLHNILNNLISNASKYSPKDTTINLKAHTKNNKLFITVKDQGMGIPTGQQSKIFDHFFRADNVANLQGTGLGLTITKKYVQLMNGQLTFESQENKGTQFNVELPFKSV